MKIKLNLRFLKEKYIELPKTATTEIISPITVKKKNYLSLIQNAVEKSAIGFSLSDFLRKNNRILIIVNDATRFTPTEKTIDAIFPMIKGKDVRIIVATGAHRPPTLYELTTVILGKYYNIFRGRIILHDATNDKEVLYIGKTTRKTEVHINRVMKEVDGVQWMSALVSEHPPWASSASAPSGFMGSKSLVLTPFRVTPQAPHHIAPFGALLPPHSDTASILTNTHKIFNCFRRRGCRDSWR